MRLFIFSLIFILSIPVLAQDRDTEEYENEFVWGINKNTAGGFIGGFTARKSRRISDKLYESVGIEIMNLKHPQEIQVGYNAGSSWIFNKINYLYPVRLQYGRELLLFKKAPQQGVEIKLITAVGPSLGLLAPYYVEVATNNSGLGTRREPYDPDGEQSIIGSGYVLQGIGESKLRLGANAKAGLSFEWGAFKSNVTGFEIGAMLDAYTQKIELLDEAENKAVFPIAFITLFYGSRR